MFFSVKMSLPIKLTVLFLCVNFFVIVRGQGIINVSDVPCGIISPQITSRIVGGRSAHISEVPWTAQIHEQSRHMNRLVYKCVGSFINKNWIISAGHCLYNRRNQSVDVRFLKAFGGRDTLTSTKKQQFQIIDVKLPAKFAFPQLTNDIALYRTQEDAIWTDYLQPICLFNYSHEALVGKKVMVAGWGYIKETRPGQFGEISNDLKITKFPVQSQETCERSFKKSYDESYMFCAGDMVGKTDTCQGDSGGSVVLNENGVHGVVGIVSQGIGCARAQYPGINTKVEVFLDWIISHVKA